MTVNDIPKDTWFLVLLLVYAIFYVAIALPISYIESKMRYIYEKIH